jgi:phage/plasmid-associated DNA primase
MKSGDTARCNGALAQFKALRDGDDVPDHDDGGRFVTQAWMRDFDAQPYAYHCTNGTLRFVETEAGRWEHCFEPGHRPEDRFMQISNVEYDPQARAPAWTARMEVMHRDPAQRMALQRIYGMGLTALISDQAFYIFQGKGQDGKSMTNDVMVQLHGAMRGDRTRNIPRRPIAGQRGASERYRTPGGRYTPRGGGRAQERLNLGRAADQAGDGQRDDRARRACNQRVELVPHWQLIVECNQLPKPPSDDRGFRRRFKLYPWVVQFGVTPGVPDEPGDVVKKRLLAEASGILNWMVKGCEEWLCERLVPQPEAAAAATASFWDVSSALGEFIAQRCDITDPDARTAATPLYQAFRQFCIDRGDREDRIMTQTNFGRSLNDAQIYAVANHATGKKERVGIRLKSAADDVSAWEDLPDDGFGADPFGRG